MPEKETSDNIEASPIELILSGISQDSKTQDPCKTVEEEIIDCKITDFSISFSFLRCGYDPMYLENP